MIESIRSEKTVENIRNAFIHILTIKEYSKITVKDISTAAGINRSTFYIYYTNKLELAEDICIIILNSFSEDLLLFFQTRGINNQRNQIKKAYLFIDKKSKIIIGLWNIKKINFNPFKIMQESVRNNCLKYFTNNNSDSRLDISIELFAELFAANLMATLKWWLTQETSHNYDLLIDNIMMCLHKGLFFLVNS